MSSSSQSSWERVPSDYDVLSSLTDSPTEGVNRQNVSSPDSFGTDLHEIYFGQDDYVPKFTPTTILSPTILPVASVVKTKLCDTSYYEIQRSANIPSIDKPSFPLSNSPSYNPPRRPSPQNHAELVGEFISRHSYSRTQYFLLWLCVWGAISDGVELMCLSFVIPHIRCQMAFSAVQVSILSSVVFIGLLCGGYLWGSLGDQWGRKTSLVLSLAMNGIFGLFSAMSNSFFQLLIFRFGAGVGVGGSIPLLFTYISEISPQERKGFYLSLLGTNWMLAGVGSSYLAYIILPLQTSVASWRLFMALCTLPAISSSMFFLIAPETPTWLASQNRIWETIQTLKLFHPNANFKELEQFDSESNYSNFESAPCKSFFDSISNFKIFSSFSVLISPKLIRRTVILWIVNFCTSFGFYGLTLWLPTIYKRMELYPTEPFCDSIKSSTDSSDCSYETLNNRAQYMDSILFAMIQLPGTILTIIGLDRMGPRLILVLSLFINSLTTFALFFSETAWESFIVSCMFSAISVFCWNSLNVVNTCSFPINIRSTATGFFSGANRIGGLFGSLLIGVFIESGCGSAMFSLFLILLLGAVAALKLPRIAA